MTSSLMLYRDFLAPDARRHILGYVRDLLAQDQASKNPPSTIRPVPVTKED